MHGDERGRFVETYRRSWFPDGREMVQGNRSEKQAGALVGLHFHLHQADYWYALRGRVRVVLHDLRVGSRTDGATEVIDLDGDVDQGVYIPPGVAHGFAALSDILLTYLVDNYYDDSRRARAGLGRPRRGGRLGRQRPDPLQAGPEQPAPRRHPRRHPAPPGRLRPASAAACASATAPDASAERSAPRRRVAPRSCRARRILLNRGRC